MLVPYNVDKKTKLVPYVTYALMAANIFFFLLSVLISNLAMAEDRIDANNLVETLVGQSLTIQHLYTMQAAGETIEGLPITKETIEEYKQSEALKKLAPQAGTPDGYKNIWQVQQMYSRVILEPHYSVINTLTYRPNNPSPLARFLSMFSAMFLHGDLSHIFSNLLYLWVFGRAAEEFLGRKFFSSVYFAAGIGSTLLEHLMAQIFTPQSMGIPLLGASGAIAGVLGLFAIRYYRTNVRVFYLMFYAWALFGPAFSVVLVITYTLTRDVTSSIVMGVIAGGAAMYVIGRKWAWGAFWAPSAYVIGVWVVVFNLIPAFYKMAIGAVGGVAYWAHIGGFALGAAYALVICGVEEGKDEYKLEDAKNALQTSGSDVAMNHAMTLLQKDQNNSAAHEVMGQAYDRRNSPELALRHYIKSMEISLKKSDGDAFLKTYNLSQLQHAEVTLPAPLLWNVARVFSQRKMWNETANALTRLIETHPESEEAEIALLRSAQLWGREFNDPAESARQLELFVNKYPNSVHSLQAKTALKLAQDQARIRNRDQAI